MRNRIVIFLTMLACFLAGAAAVHAQGLQKVKFNADYSLQDIRADYGIIATTRGNGMNARCTQITYSRRFWRHLAWKAGVVSVPYPGGFEWLAGAPIAISYRTGTVSYEDAIGYALGSSISDVVYENIWGNPDNLWGDILFNIFMSLFRRSEFFIGVTPGLYLGERTQSELVQTYGRFAVTGDLGLVLSIPIWRFSLNITPAFHYSFTHNYDYDNVPTRSLISVQAGIGFLF